ncbi:unnamed protein product [Sphenostylis stenocarpa]|uniref:Uncharacterized protein n=1 Tax=Sphenostylis stenocarpa TaxID=92480 RepID=A0AA86VH11_9FABA|nr:unnamed protein product [Sphenostylis stenocarpa]
MVPTQSVTKLHEEKEGQRDEDGKRWMHCGGAMVIEKVVLALCGGSAFVSCSTRLVNDGDARVKETNE